MKDNTNNFLFLYSVVWRIGGVRQRELKIKDMNVQEQLKTVHSHLMYNKFPYHSVSVINRHQDLGLHVIFMESVKYMVTDEIKGYLKANKFTYSYVA